MRHAEADRGLLGPERGVVARLVAVLEGVAFWAAATFPFVHLGAVVLYARGTLPGTVLVALAAVHAAAIVAGHRHNRADGGDA